MDLDTRTGHAGGGVLDFEGRGITGCGERIRACGK